MNSGVMPVTMVISATSFLPITKQDLSLLVRYWGAEWGNRKFDIYIDDEKLITEDNTGKWNQSKFQDIEYTIPDAYD